MKKINKKRLGRYAEDIAACFLRRQGYKIIERNFFCRLGEIDIVADDAGELVFVEVRSSSGYRFADPIESLRDRKIRRLKNVGLVWLSRHRIQGRSIRFDAVAIVFRDGYRRKALERLLGRRRYLEIRHIKGIL